MSIALVTDSTASLPAGVAAERDITVVPLQVVIGATSYEIYRRSPGGSFASRGTSLTTSFNDSASANTAYLYRVRAVNLGGSSGDSSADLATTVMFTEDPMSAGVPVRAVHLSQLRTAVSAVRAQAGLSSATYTDPAAPGVIVRAIHIAELRTYLDQALAALGRTTGGWTGATLRGAVIRATHLQQIRDRVK